VGGGNFGASPLNPYNPSYDHRFPCTISPSVQRTVLYDFPSSKLQRTQEAIAGRFQVSTIVTAVSGDALNVSYSGTSNTERTTSGRRCSRPSGKFPAEPDCDEQFNTAAFTAPQPVIRHLAGARAPSGCLVCSMIFSATKGFKLGEGGICNFGGFLHAFKHYNLTGPITPTSLRNLRQDQ